MNHQRLLWNMDWVATVVLRKQLNFKSAVIRSNRSSSISFDFATQTKPVNRLSKCAEGLQSKRVGWKTWNAGIRNRNARNTPNTLIIRNGPKIVNCD